MNTLLTSNAIEEPETTEGREYAREASEDVTQPSSNDSRLSKSGSLTRDDNGDRSDEATYVNTDECTYETQETYERQEIQETRETSEREQSNGSEAREELNDLNPGLWMK